MERKQLTEIVKSKMKETGWNNKKILDWIFSTYKTEDWIDNEKIKTYDDLIRFVRWCRKKVAVIHLGTPKPTYEQKIHNSYEKSQSIGTSLPISIIKEIRMNVDNPSGFLRLIIEKYYKEELRNLMAKTSQG